jgi:hypothetical protein
MLQIAARHLLARRFHHLIGLKPKEGGLLRPGLLLQKGSRLQLPLKLTASSDRAFGERNIQPSEELFKNDFRFLI